MVRNVNALFVLFTHDQIYSLHRFKQTLVRMCIYLYICGCMYVYACIYMYVHVYVHVYVRVCMYIYIYMCVCHFYILRHFFYYLCVLSISLIHPTLHFYVNLY